jgi:hypothetical protein
MIGPAGHGAPDPEILLDGDWQSIRTVVDVGGGTGALLAEILRAHSHLTGILVDLPRTVARAPETFQTAGVSDRVTMVGQSFFDELPAGADLYILKSILNDWPEAETKEILLRCAEAAAPNGRIVVNGGINPNELPGGLNIEMLLVGGQNQSLSEFEATTLDCGLNVVRSGRSPSGRFIVECRPI